MNLSKYFNKNIFEKVIDFYDVKKEIYRILNYSISQLISWSDNDIQRQRRDEVLNNFRYIVKHLINKDELILSKGELIGSLNIHMIEKNTSYQYTDRFLQPWNAQSYPKFFDEYLKLLNSSLMNSDMYKTFVSFDDWNGDLITSLNESDIENLQILTKKYLEFKSPKKIDQLDKLFIETLLNFYKNIINKTNKMNKHNKYNFRANTPQVGMLYVTNWKNFRESI